MPFFFFSSLHLLTEWLLQTHLYDVEPQELVCLELFCPHHQRSAAAGKKENDMRAYNVFPGSTKPS